MPTNLSLYVKSLMVGTPVETLAKELRWLVGSRRRHQHPELWELRLEERRLPVVLAKLLNKNSRCLDVGCHLGSFLTLIRKYAPEGEHTAFEASPTKSGWLKSKFPTVEIRQCAVTDRTGTIAFEEDLARPGYSHIGRGQEASPDIAHYEVPAYQLDDLLSDNRKVDFIKLDIEGAELAALRGGRKLIETWHPPIIFECANEAALKEQKLDRKELYDFLTNDFGYQIFCFGDFLYDKPSMTFGEFLKCGLYPYRAFNFLALSRRAASQE